MAEENILRVCKYWAGIMSSTRFSWDELVNVAYIGACKVENPKFLQAAARFSIINFMRKELRSVTYQDTKRNVIYKRERLLRNTYYPPEFIETLEELKLAVEKAKLSELDRQVLSMRFVDEMRLVDIASVVGVTDAAISDRLSKVTKKLRRALKGRLK